MSVGLDQLEKAFEEILKAAGVSPEDEFIEKHHCLFLVNLAQTGNTQPEINDKSLASAFEKDFEALSDPASGKLARRRLIEHLLLRMRDKGLTIY